MAERSTASAPMPVRDEAALNAPGELPLPVSAKPMASMQQIVRAAALLETLTQRAVRDERLNAGDMTVLYILERGVGEAPIRGVDLQRALMNTSGAITKRLDRLQAASLVVRRPDPTDGRAVLVEITPEGLALTGRVRAAGGWTLSERISETLSDAEWDVVHALLERIVGTLERRLAS